MKKLIAFFVDNPIWGNVFIIITFLFGVLVLSEIKTSSMPEREYRMVSVSVTYPGASPEEIEKGITRKVENIIRPVQGITEVTSTSSENVSFLSIFVSENVDFDEVFEEIKNAVGQINTLPVSAQKPVVQKSHKKDRAAIISITGDAPLFELKKDIDAVKEDFLSSDVISSVEINGLPETEIVIEVKAEELARYQLNMDILARNIQSNNVDLSGGALKTNRDEILIRMRQRKTKAEDLAEILVFSDPKGKDIRLKDIAEVREQFVEGTSIGYVNGKEGAFMWIMKSTEEDLEEISSYLAQYAKDFNAQYDDKEIRVLWDFYESLGFQIDLLITNGLYGALFVCIALGLFLNLRLSLWVAWGIPASFLGMFILTSFIPITINNISLFGMIVVVGILVDDGIVIAENIFAHFERGKSARRAAIDGTLEVLPAIVTSIVTTMLAFIPLLAVEGWLSIIFDLGIVVIASLGFSLLEATLVLPAHLANKKTLGGVQNADSKIGLARFATSLLTFLRDKVYAPVLDWSIRYKYITVMLPFAFVIILIGTIISGNVGMTYFPRQSHDNFQLELAFKPGEKAEKTERYLKRFERLIWEVNEDYYQEYQDSLVQYTTLIVGNTNQMAESGDHCGKVEVNLDLKEFPIMSQEVVQKVREKIGEVPEIDKLIIGTESRQGKPFGVSIQSRDLEELEAATAWLKSRLEKVPDLADISDDISKGKQELSITLKPQARYLGLSSNEIMRQIRQAYFGKEIQSMVNGDQEQKVWLRFPLEDRKSLDQLDQMLILSPEGNYYPLHTLVDYQLARGITRIRRTDGFRSVKVTADFSDPLADAIPIYNKIDKTILSQLNKKFPGVTIASAEARKGAKSSFNSILLRLPIVVVLMFIVVALNFRNFYQSILVMLLIPIGICCSVLGHFFHGESMSMVSFFGILAIGGVIVNDAVVMLDKFNANLKEGLSLEEAVRNAGMARFRAILLTSLTTVAGLAPLLFLPAEEGRFIKPMAISMAYGIGLGTLFILFFFPVMILSGNAFIRRLVWKGMKVDYVLFVCMVTFLIGIVLGHQQTVMIGLGLVFLGPFLIVMINKISRKLRSRTLVSPLSVEPALIQINKEEDEA